MVSESTNNGVSCSNKRSSSPTSFTPRIFSDVAGDITVVVDGEAFLLHKFPLVSRSGRIRRLIADGKDSNLSKLELPDLPGGAQAFELAMKFCYGINFEITDANVAHLRCASEYLEMTEDYRDQNLISRTEYYLNLVVTPSLEKSAHVLSTCEMLPSVAEEVGIPTRCIEAIAINACKEQLASGFSRLDCDNDAGSLEHRSGCIDWWVEDLSVLGIDYYQRVIRAMERLGVHPDSIAASLMRYAQASLKGIGKSQMWNPAKMKAGRCSGENDQSSILESLVSLLPAEKRCSVPLNFLFGMLRMAIMLDAGIACRLELERRVALRLEMVSLDDLLIPSVRSGESLFDVDSVHRIVVNFLQRVEEENEDHGYDSEGLASPGHGSLLKVGRLVDAYLAEIAPDPYLSLQKFIAMIEILPDYARVIDDGLYRAIDIFLKAHPMLYEQETKKLCKFVDCQKLSQEASNHAAQNDRLPVQMTVRVLYFEQLRLKNSMSASSGDLFLSQRISSGVPSAAMSPRDNYASLRRENRELKMEISRMRMRLSELEKEHMCMKQGMIDKSGNGRTIFTSISKGIGRIGIFSGPSGGRQQKSKSRRARVSDGKNGKSRRHSLS